MQFRTSVLLTAALVGTGFTASANAQAFQDNFDGVDNYSQRFITPDNSARNGVFENPPPAGFFGGFFDRFGIVTHNPAGTGATAFQQLPRDTIDDSAFDVSGGGQFAIDDKGIIRSNDTDALVMLADTANNQNLAGQTFITWTFDLSNATAGATQLAVVSNFAAQGRFETDVQGTPDEFKFGYGEDLTLAELGNPNNFANVLTGAAENDTFYTVTMESGTVYDRYFNPFWNAGTIADWTQLTTTGPFGSITYHPNDNGMDGDTTAQDGFIPVEGAFGVVEERALRDGTFNDEEFEAYERPIVMTNATGNQTTLNNEFKTVSSLFNVSSSTNELAIQFEGFTDGSVEYFMFDDFFVTVAGDANLDGAVSLADLSLLGNNFNQAGDWSDGDFNGDGVVSLADLSILGGNFNQSLNGPVAASLSFEEALVATGLSDLVAVPEPASLVLLGLGGLGLLGRRRVR